MNGRGVQAARDCYTANVRYWPKADIQIALILSSLIPARDYAGSPSAIPVNDIALTASRYASPFDVQFRFC